MPSSIQVFKFGGAALQDALGMQRAAAIAKEQWEKTPLVVVVSASGKTTRLLHTLFAAPTVQGWKQLLEHHQALCKALPTALYAEAMDAVAHWYIDACAWHVKQVVDCTSEQAYAHFLARGEDIAAILLQYYLRAIDIPVCLRDARSMIKTTTGFTAAQVDPTTTYPNLVGGLRPVLEEKVLPVVQGFVGSNDVGLTTLLGFEGSDYTAAIVAAALEAELITLWKDVPGIMTGDPALFPQATLIKELTYEAVQDLVADGAKVIHSKTLAPLQKAGIPLHIRSFLATDQLGSYICRTASPLVAPVAMVRENVHLVCLKGTDLPQIKTIPPQIEIYGGMVVFSHRKTERCYWLGFTMSVDVQLDKLLSQLEALGTCTHYFPATLVTSHRDPTGQFMQQWLDTYEVIHQVPIGKDGLQAVGQLKA